MLHQYEQAGAAEHRETSAPPVAARIVNTPAANAKKVQRSAWHLALHADTLDGMLRNVGLREVAGERLKDEDPR